MPYFKSNTINILLIHIPKTGGTSLEHYFAHKIHIQITRDNLYGFLPTEQATQLNITSSLQHLTYLQLMKNADFFNIDTNNFTVIAVIRNPYERIISSLFFQSKLPNHPTQQQVFDTIQYFINATDVDNHNIPQYKFVTDENKQIIPTITILKTETLTIDMHKLGFTDFNLNVNTNRHGITDYFQFLNNDSIKLINEFYKDDFAIFNFPMINPE
jgi:hypothetical protein